MDLIPFRKDVFSQCGEDGILEKIFEVIGVTKGTCVEFGAWDGKLFSNSANLLLNKEWSGVLIEGSEKKFPDLQNTYNGRSDCILLNRMVGFDPPDLLDDILAPLPVPKNFDLLSIDVDGNDYHIFDSVKRYCPKVVICEYNPTMPNWFAFAQKRDMNVNNGSSLAAFVKLGKEKNYELVCCTDFNAIFVERTYFPLFEIADNSIDALHGDMRYYSWLIQMYDGTLRVIGNGKMLWHGIRIDDERMQMLPRELRRFPDKVG
jgi:hypothetical protein